MGYYYELNQDWWNAYAGIRVDDEDRPASEPPEDVNSTLRRRKL